VDSSAESVLSAKSVLSTESVLGSEIHDSYTCNMVGAFFISSLLATLVRSLWNLELRMRSIPSDGIFKLMLCTAPIVPLKIIYKDSRRTDEVVNCIRWNR